MKDNLLTILVHNRLTNYIVNKSNKDLFSLTIILCWLV